MELFNEPVSFEWDAGNKDKSWVKHRVTHEECEEVFFDPHKRILDTQAHEGFEKRFLLLGQTKSQRVLFVVFTMRGHRVRVISARDLNRREKALYEKED